MCAEREPVLPEKQWILALVNSIDATERTAGVRQETHDFLFCLTNGTGRRGRSDLLCGWRQRSVFPAAEAERRKPRAPPDQGAPPAVSVVVAPVVQKTVPIFTELTARTDATDSVEIRARVKAFL